ncbi:hypothetical protein JKA74_18820 [Marivirga sp. S37H4]|uniref:Uncharacterized protein n=1 Tax=Marivirga aurantiaca TaxID=2802615 RepID=A0A934X2D0_9BACT|nr:hypothetical protein [Marivirga aurantiaca]MBK6267105.1 hypothetical protein [Marivirga aurantiaca]
MRLILILYIFLTLTGIQNAFSQDAFPFFEESDKIPKDLLNERSVVFMNVKNLNWDEQARKIHQYFAETGVDAVAYYSLSDILSGHDASNSFYNDITSRSIENMIIVHQTDNAYSLYISDIPKGGTFFTESMLVYELKAKTLEELGKSLLTKTEQASLSRSNFLIIDVPETFKRTHVIKSRRLADYNADLRIDKLAVPKFEKNVMMTEDIGEANETLDSLMQTHYPFRYGLVNANISDEEMIAQGYLMVLRKLENNGESLKRMLGYNTSDDETLYISVRKGPLSQVSKFTKGDKVHKYYIQQLYTKDIYLGEEWDADTTWQEALINHTENIKNALKDQ